DRTSKYCAMVLPITLAVAPSATNTVAKPSTKASAANIMRRRASLVMLSDLSSSKLNPASQARHGGTIGSTQGDTKESSPARSAAPKLISSMFFSSPGPGLQVVSRLKYANNSIYCKDAGFEDAFFSPRPCHIVSADAMG